MTIPGAGTDAIAEAFARPQSEGRSALIAYLTLGYPSRSDTLRLVPAIEAGGADIIELGVPFSDPIADGPTIQAASQAALRAGMTPSDALCVTRELRAAGVKSPFLLMGYYNPIHNYGLERYARDCAYAGVSGLIVPDLPPEEAETLQRACQKHGLALVFLVAPTSGPQRIASIAAASEGFVYVVSRLGTTGSGTIVQEELVSRLNLVRQHASVPIAVGFGISTPSQAAHLAHLADGIIVGSAIVKRASQGAETVRAYVSSLRAALDGAAERSVATNES